MDDNKNVWAEIRNNFIDEETGDISIDAWLTGNDDEQGTVIAIVHNDGTVDYKDERAKTDKYAQEMINEAISSLSATSLHVTVLEEMIKYFESAHKLACEDGNEGLYKKLAKYLEFLENLRGLYWRCTGCDRFVAPDEEYVENREDYYCMKCANEGI